MTFHFTAVVLYLHQEVALNIFQAAVDENLMDHFIWIGPDGWGNRFFDQVTRTVTTSGSESDISFLIHVF